MTSARDGLVGGGKLRDSKDLSINNLPARRLIIDRADTEAASWSCSRSRAERGSIGRICLARPGEGGGAEIEQRRLLRAGTALRGQPASGFS